MKLKFIRMFFCHDVTTKNKNNSIDQSKITSGKNTNERKLNVELKNTLPIN